MAYIIPTAADLKARYPEFEQVAEPVLVGALGDAAMAVDTSWPEVAFRPAWMLYTAHVLSLAGHNPNLQAASSATPGLKSEQAGGTKYEYFSPAEMSGIEAGSASWFGMTPFGQEFARLQRRYFAGPRVY